VAKKPKDDEKDEPKVKQPRLPHTVPPEDAILIETAEEYIDAVNKEKRAKKSKDDCLSTLLERMRQKRRKQIIVGGYTITVYDKEKLTVVERKDPELDPKKPVEKEKLETAGAK
jgi:hypothetical protein